MFVCLKHRITTTRQQPGWERPEGPRQSIWKCLQVHLVKDGNCGRYFRSQSDFYDWENWAGSGPLLGDAGTMRTVPRSGRRMGSSGLPILLIPF